MLIKLLGLRFFFFTIFTFGAGILVRELLVRALFFFDDTGGKGMLLSTKTQVFLALAQ